MKDKKKTIGIFVLVLLVGCFLYFKARATYTSYESNVEGRVSTNVGEIHIKINGVDVVATNDGTLDNRVILDNITWESTHTREGKISPGSTGTIDLEVDPSGSEVAILYEFRFVDQQIDEDKLLTFSNIVPAEGMVRTSADTYTGVITLNDITAGKKYHLSTDFLFDYITDIEGITEDNQILDDLFEIHFHAVQYEGETITPYTGG